MLLTWACNGDRSSVSTEDSTAASGIDGGEASALIEAAADPLGSHLGARYPASLAAVVEKRFLRVLTSRNAFDFFIQEGHRGGYQYDLVRAFTEFLNQRHPGRRSIQFELIPVEDQDLIPLLLDGTADLVAARLTITPARAKQVAFSQPYRVVDERVVTHDETQSIESAEDLSGRAVVVRAGSSYHASLRRLSKELEAAGREPVEIEALEESLATERILELVAARRFHYSVADSMIAEVATEVHPHLRVVEGVTLRNGARLAWATTPNARRLLDEMDAFLQSHAHGTLLGNLAYRRYFEDDAALAARLAEGQESSLSPYDPIFKKYAQAYGFDWRLMAALAYQESRFDPVARNPSGATGLMQIKPSTARESYVDVPEIEGPENLDSNVEAGVKYLAWIQNRYFDPEAGLKERDSLRMALAAYNAGPRAVLRARERAKKRGRDPDRWFGHVELALREMRKLEPVNYVSDINQRYLSYVLLGIK